MKCSVSNEMTCYPASKIVIKCFTRYCYPASKIVLSLHFYNVIILHVAQLVQLHLYTLAQQVFYGASNSVTGNNCTH